MPDAPDKLEDNEVKRALPRPTARPGDVKRQTDWATLITLVGGLALVVVLGIFIVTQFGPKKEAEINWQVNSPIVNVYPDATLIASDSSQTDSYKHVWRLYASKDDLGKIKQFYQDQFIGLGYKYDTGNTQTFPLDFSKVESNKCQTVRYGLDVAGLDENRIDLPGVNPDDLKRRYQGQTIFVVHQFDTSSREPGC